MNALQLLKKDHRTVEALFKRFEKAGASAHKLKGSLAKRIVKELSIHASIEEQLLYPAARIRSEKLEEKVLEAMEEHHVAKWTLDEINKLTPDDERFNAKVTVLMESVRHHVEEEEETLFPKLERLMSREELEALGNALAKAKRVAPTHPHPMAPDTPPGNVITGVLAKILDTGKELMRSEGGRRSRVSRQPAFAKTTRSRKPGKTTKAKQKTSRSR